MAAVTPKLTHVLVCSVTAVLLAAVGTHAQSTTAKPDPAMPPATQKPMPPTTQKPVPPTPQKPANVPPPAPAGVPTPPDYVIGPDDMLAIVVWRDKDVSTEVMVRPDGKISLPLLNDVQAAGLTPEQLRAAITTAAEKYMESPSVSVIVKAINSRKVFIMGQVNKPGPYVITTPTSVLQLIAIAGGLQEYADSKNIRVMRTDTAGKAESFRFNYKDVAAGKNLAQNITLKPGDTVIVP